MDSRHRFHFIYFKWMAQNLVWIILFIAVLVFVKPVELAGSAFIIQAQDTVGAVALVQDVGGEITHKLGIINAVGAILTPRQAATLERNPATIRLYADQTLVTAGGGLGSISNTLVEADILQAAGLTGE